MICCNLVGSYWVDFSDNSNHSTVQKSTLAIAQVMFVPWDDCRIETFIQHKITIAVGLFSLCDWLRTKRTLQLVPIWSEQMKNLFPVREPVWNANSLKILLFIASFAFQVLDVFFRLQESFCSSATSLENGNIMKQWKLLYVEIGHRTREAAITV